MLVFKTSWRRLQVMSWKRPQHVFSVTIFALPRRLEDVLKTSWEIEVTLKTSWRRRLFFYRLWKTFFTEDIWTTASEFVTEMLIFRTSRSQMFFKISVILEPLSNNIVADLLLQNTYGGYFRIFVAANTFL